MTRPEEHFEKLRSCIPEGGNSPARAFHAAGETPVFMDRAGEPTQKQLDKYDKLKTYLRELGTVAVAFSAGVDSTFLLKTAWDTLGDCAIAVTVRTPFFPERETKESEEFCRREGIRQYFCDVGIGEIDGFAQNPQNRCYLCKRVLFENMAETAGKHNVEYVVDGSNVDDLGDYRPGMQAVEELGIKSPLKDCGLTKEDIRALSRYLGLGTWDKPSLACLASRFAYGQRISREALGVVERAEQMLMDMGAGQCRVRVHGELARIEVPPETFPVLTEPEHCRQIVQLLKESGFTYVTMDLAGYRTGSMNEVLKEQ